jgi:hypothetical protein
VDKTMRIVTVIGILGIFVWAEATASAQPPSAPPPRQRGNRGLANVNALAARMMTLDTDGDGRISRKELTDERLHSLFERADTDDDGMLSREEITDCFTKELAVAERAQRSRPPGGRGGFGPPPDGRPPGGPRPAE